jgi:hypothetical protein
LCDTFPAHAIDIAFGVLFQRLAGTVARHGVAEILRACVAVSAVHAYTEHRVYAHARLADAGRVAKATGEPIALVSDALAHRVCSVAGTVNGALVSVVAIHQSTRVLFARTSYTKASCPLGVTRSPVRGCFKRAGRINANIIGARVGVVAQHANAGVIRIEAPTPIGNLALWTDALVALKLATDAWDRPAVGSVRGQFLPGGTGLSDLGTAREQEPQGKGQNPIEGDLVHS